jgi:putative addiction module component (TIGR02574 family)
MSSLLREDLLKLSVAERIQLAEDLWDSIVADPESHELTDPQREELERRLAGVQSGGARVVAWTELRAELMGDE